MRKYLIALLGFLSGVMVYYMKAPARETASIQDEFHQQSFVTITQAAPAPATPAPSIPVATIVIDPSEEEKRNIPGLPRGMQLAPNVRAVAEEDYKEGQILMKKNGFVFIRSHGGAANVVYDQRLNTFHPIMATIKLTDVDEAQRSANLREWTEYHYNSDLAVQYIQSTHEDLLDDYKKLEQSGFQASLEVVKAVYQSR